MGERQHLLFHPTACGGSKVKEAILHMEGPVHPETFLGQIGAHLSGCAPDGGAK
jgi:hypothetical protein